MFKIISRTVLGFAQIVNIIQPLICKILCLTLTVSIFLFGDAVISVIKLKLNSILCFYSHHTVTTYINIKQNSFPPSGGEGT